MMRRAYAAAAGLTFAVACAAPAFAAGEPWSGFYVGGHLGWTGDTSDLSFRDQSPTGDLTFHDNGGGSGILGGGQAGYNTWIGNMLAGVEGDVSWARHADYLASVRGRLGFGNDRWIGYGTAGIAFIGGKERFSAYSSSLDAMQRFSRSGDDTGFVGGAGLEYALAPNLGLGVEGLWYDFGSDHHFIPGPSGEDFTVHDKRDFGTVRTRLTWYLNQ